MTQNIREKLTALADPEYREFTAGLLPTVKPEIILGVRIPDLRRLAKTLRREEKVAAEAFLRELPHACHDENILHALLINEEKDYSTALALTEDFLPRVDNWAVCDMLNPRAFTKDLPRLREDILRWHGSERIYTVRFSLGMLMRLFLDEHFYPGALELAAETDNDDYYARMMVAWFFATALATQYDAALPYLTENRLPLWTHNKTIQKAVESRRITAETKTYLKSLRRRA